MPRRRWLIRSEVRHPAAAGKLLSNPPMDGFAVSAVGRTDLSELRTPSRKRGEAKSEIIEELRRNVSIAQCDGPDQKSRRVQGTVRLLGNIPGPQTQSTTT